jgi:hypothetical protein
VEVRASVKASKMWAASYKGLMTGRVPVSTRWDGGSHDHGISNENLKGGEKL